MFKAIQTSVSGLIASSVRANTAASNIVNSTVTSSPSSSPNFTPHHVAQSTTSTGGVRATVVATSPASLSVFDPTSPFANHQGNVDSPNVSLPVEIGELSRARHAYEANAKVIQSLDETFKSLLKI